MAESKIASRQRQISGYFESFIRVLDIGIHGSGDRAVKVAAHVPMLSHQDTEETIFLRQSFPIIVALSQRKAITLLTGNSLILPTGWSLCLAEDYNLRLSK